MKFATQISIPGSFWFCSFGNFFSTSTHKKKTSKLLIGHCSGRTELNMMCIGDKSDLYGKNSCFELSFDTWKTGVGIKSLKLSRSLLLKRKKGDWGKCTAFGPKLNLSRRPSKCKIHVCHIIFVFRWYHNSIGQGNVGPNNLNTLSKKKSYTKKCSLLFFIN